MGETLERYGIFDASGQTVYPGSVLGEAYIEYVTAVGPVEFQNEGREIGLTYLLHLAPGKGQFVEYGVNFAPVERHRYRDLSPGSPEMAF